MKCEYYPEKECLYLHKCQGVGCAGDLHKPREEIRYPTKRSPWQTGYKRDDTGEMK